MGKVVWRLSLRRFREKHPRLLDDSEKKLHGQYDGTSGEHQSEPAASSRSSFRVPSKGSSRSAAWKNPGAYINGTTSQLSNQTISQVSSQGRRYNLETEQLGLCLEITRYARTLSETRSDNARSDGELFNLIRQRYEAIKHPISPLWMRFKRPGQALFVKVIAPV